MSKMPRHWIEALFKKFLIRYGILWADRYKGLGLSPDEIADEWATELAGFSSEEIKRGLEASKGNKFPPTLPEFLSLCRPSSLIRPSADEAWAIAIKAKNESETVVWTEDMAQAWSICKPVMDSEDEVGARMAFKAAYDRLCLEGRPVVWAISQGWDSERRLIAVEKAQSSGVAIGYEPREQLFLESKHTPMPDSVRAVLEVLKSKPEHQSITDRDREVTARMKKESAEKLQEYRK